MVSINNVDISTTGSITNSIFQQYFPGGNQLVKNTSYSVEGVQNRTLHSTLFENVASGFNLHRNPRSALKFNEVGISSSLESLLTAGAETAFSSSTAVSIQNPEGAGSLTGGTAFARVLADGNLVGTAGYEDISGAIIRNIFTTPMATDAINGTSIDGNNHSDISGQHNPLAPSGGSREVALQANMTAQEIGWLIERGTHLATINEDGFSTQNRGVLSNGWDFDIPNQYAALNLKYMDNGKSSFPGLTGDNTGLVSLDIINASSQRAYICPALIEFLIYLYSKIDFYAGFGIDRSWNVAVTEGGSLTNHRVGRAVDISLISTLDKSQIYNIQETAGDEQMYTKAFELLMQAVNSAPTYLQPDMIIVSHEIGQQYGIDSGDNGTEPASAEIRIKYPNCQYTQFYADLAGNHTDHIHVSFLAARAGIYSGPNGVLTGTVNTAASGNYSSNDSGGGLLEDGSVYIPGIGVFRPTANYNNPKFTSSYKATKENQLVADEVFDLLSNICYPELAAIMTAISQREGNVASFNSNIDSGDVSFGFLQNNMYGSHGTVPFFIPYPTPTQVDGWKLIAPGYDFFGLTSWQQWKGWIKDSFNAALDKDQFEIDVKASTDERLWYPINQAYIAYRTMCGNNPTYPLPLINRLGELPEMQHVMTPWGDYGGGPASGPIYKTKFKDARDVYMRKTFKSIDKATQDLSDWIIRYFSTPLNGATSRSVPYIEGWLSGNVYNRDGTINTVVPL